MATVQTDDGAIEVPASKITFGDDETPTVYAHLPELDGAVEVSIMTDDDELDLEA